MPLLTRQLAYKMAERSKKIYKNYKNNKNEEYDGIISELIKEGQYLGELYMS